MSDDDERLIRCFVAAFPTASREEIRTSAFDGIPGWDSLRAVTLLAVLDEEFGAQIDLPELLDLETFDSVRRYLGQRGLLSQAHE